MNTRQLVLFHIIKGLILTIIKLTMRIICTKAAISVLFNNTKTIIAFMEDQTTLIEIQDMVSTNIITRIKIIRTSTIILLLILTATLVSSNNFKKTYTLCLFLKMKITNNSKLIPSLVFINSRTNNLCSSNHNSKRCIHSNNSSINHLVTFHDT